MRILLVGEGRSPIHEEAWQRGLEAAGCVVQRFDWVMRFQSTSPLLSFVLRAQNHFLVGPAISSLNAELIDRVTSDPPDVLLLYRPTHVLAATLRAIRARVPSVLVVNYNNDDPFSPLAPPHLWRHYLEGLPSVDVAIAYREKNLGELTAAGAPRVHLLRSYYLPYIHHPVDVAESDKEAFGADVSFVGHYEADGRLPYLAAVAEAFPCFRLFGPDWDRAPDHPALRHLLPTRSLSLTDYVKAIQCSKISLVFFSGLNNDTYTRRVFEIPAVGTFMLCQRTADMETLFRQGVEADYFSSPDELVKKTRHYLDHEDERARIAATGATRVREAGHDVFSRMRELADLLRGWGELKSKDAPVAGCDPPSDPQMDSPRPQAPQVVGSPPAQSQRRRCSLEPLDQDHGGRVRAESRPMHALRRLGLDGLAWPLRRLHVPVSDDALVLEVGSGGNPYPRSNVLLDAYESTRERHFQPLVVDRPTVVALVEKLPFRDNAFDFVIASHVLEHALDPRAFLAELQRVARAGYIECPDALFERLNPYRDHRLEVTERAGELLLRPKQAWRHDPEVVELYEARLYRSRPWAHYLRRNPFAFHMRYYWSRDTGGIRYRLVGPDQAAGAFIGGGHAQASSPQASNSLWTTLVSTARWLVSQRKRNAALDLASLLRCPACGGTSLAQSPRGILCSGCGRVYEMDGRLVRMWSPVTSGVESSTRQP